MIKSINKFSSAGAIAAEAQSLADRQVDNDIFNGYVGPRGNGGSRGTVNHTSHVVQVGGAGTHVSAVKGDYNQHGSFVGQARRRGNNGPRGTNGTADTNKTKKQGNKTNAIRERSIKSLTKHYQVDETLIRKLYDGKICVKFNLGSEGCTDKNCKFKHEKYSTGHANHFNAGVYDNAEANRFSMLDF